MANDVHPTCRVIRPDATYSGAELHDGRLRRDGRGHRDLHAPPDHPPPGGRAKAHLHENHETAIYMIDGEVEMWFGDRLEQHCVLRTGEFLYIPAGVPHLPTNRSGRPATAVLARTDPNEQESVVLRPDLEALAPAD